MSNMSTSTSAVIAIAEPLFTSQERLALAGVPGRSRHRSQAMPFGRLPYVKAARSLFHRHRQHSRLGSDGRLLHGTFQARGSAKSFAG